MRTRTETSSTVNRQLDSYTLNYGCFALACKAHTHTVCFVCSQSLSLSAHQAMCHWKRRECIGTHTHRRRSASEANGAGEPGEHSKLAILQRREKEGPYTVRGSRVPYYPVHMAVDYSLCWPVCDRGRSVLLD